MTVRELPVELASAVAEAMNMLGVVACSPALAQMRQEQSPREIRQSLLGYLGKLLQFISMLRRGPSSNEQFISAEPALLEMQRRVMQWNPDDEPRQDLTEQARVCLNALGVHTPVGGWDSLHLNDSE